jgi:hypothetical protein
MHWPCRLDSARSYSLNRSGMRSGLACPTFGGGCPKNPAARPTSCRHVLRGPCIEISDGDRVGPAEPSADVLAWNQPLAG